MVAPCRSLAPSGALLGLGCLLPVVLCSACGGESYAVRERRLRSIPPTAIVSSDGHTATVIPGGEYAADRLEQIFVGEHYRDLWVTPIRVPVLDLTTFAGGLTPIKQGGGRQTASLRLQARDGRQFVFRTVAKDSSDIVPALLRATPVADILQDQVSAMNPAAALVVDELAHALGVFHAHPVLVLAPDDARLGEYRSAFADRLGIIEEYPVAGIGGSDVIAGAEKIVSTRKLLKELKQNSEDRVDSRSYLTARLLDMLVGDWDRHDEQWRWARRRERGRQVYSPLPRDRDQAFARFDGLFPRIAEITSVQMEGFSENLDDIPDLMHSGRVFDRRILTDLDKSTWDSVTSEAVAKITDSVIDGAVRRLPQPYYELRGAWLAAALRSRRDRLQAASEIYYRSLARSVEIQLSDKAEYLALQFLDDRRTAVTAYRRDKSGGGPKGEAVYARIFFADETDEVRIQLLGGDDTVLASGDARSHLVVRIEGGATADTFVDDRSAPGEGGGGIFFLPRPVGADEP